MHSLWETQNWEEASEAEVISALFNPPPFIDPVDMGAIKKYHPSAKAKYLNMFYHGEIPGWVKNFNKL